MVNEWPVVAARVPSPKLTASVKQATRRIREGMAGSCISVFVRIIAPRVAKTNNRGWWTGNEQQQSSSNSGNGQESSSSNTGNEQQQSSSNTGNEQQQ
ncbi:MAG: hypothetical protein WAJ93_02175, partial [Candidatus Nitrosopolaris sp.]